MQYRLLGRTGFSVSEVSLGTWQVGGKWGEKFDHHNADRILNQAVDAGINFIDTADVYSDGLSEKAVGRLVKNRTERIYIATKCGRKLQPHVNLSYQPGILRKFVEDSLLNIGVDCIDLIQLHCPPAEVYERPEIFEGFETLQREGKIKYLGVSVEKVEEALKAIMYPNVMTVQIIFNMFRLKPAEHFFKEARKSKIGILARVPLASGLLTGKFNKNSVFGIEDHRNFNRHGEAFDQGETFSGVEYETGLKAVEELRKVFPDQSNLAQVALRWILMFDAVSCVIPGASNPEQLRSNVGAGSHSPISEQQMESVRKIYNEKIRPSVHNRW